MNRTWRRIEERRRRCIRRHRGVPWRGRFIKALRECRRGDYIIRQSCHTGPIRGQADDHAVGLELRAQRVNRQSAAKGSVIDEEDVDRAIWNVVEAGGRYGRRSGSPDDAARSLIERGDRLFVGIWKSASAHRQDGAAAAKPSSITGLSDGVPPESTARPALPFSKASLQPGRSPAACLSTASESAPASPRTPVPERRN